MKLISSRTNMLSTKSQYISQRTHRMNVFRIWVNQHDHGRQKHRGIHFTSAFALFALVLRSSFYIKYFHFDDCVNIIAWSWIEIKNNNNNKKQQKKEKKTANSMQLRGWWRYITPIHVMRIYVYVCVCVHKSRKEKMEHW